MKVYVYLVFPFIIFPHSYLQDYFSQYWYFIDNFHREMKQLIYMDDGLQ